MEEHTIIGEPATGPLDPDWLARDELRINQVQPQ